MAMLLIKELISPITNDSTILNAVMLTTGHWSSEEVRSEE